jgi:hypothetical protein
LRHSGGVGQKGLGRGDGVNGEVMGREGGR